MSFVIHDVAGENIIIDYASVATVDFATVTNAKVSNAKVAVVWTLWSGRTIRVECSHSDCSKLFGEAIAQRSARRGIGNVFAP